MTELMGYLYKYYLGFIFSHKSNWFEPYFNIGYWVQFINQTNIDVMDSDAIISELGLNFWVNKSFIINLSIEHNFSSRWIFNKDSDGSLSERFELIGPKLGITYRF